MNHISSSISILIAAIASTAYLKGSLDMILDNTE